MTLPPVLKVGGYFLGKMVPLRKPKEIKEANKELSKEKEALAKLPVGMLFKYAKSEH
jgi:hypothetical protein